MPDRTAVTARLRERIREAAATGGGWGYYGGKRPRLEPTCWALAALRLSWDGTEEEWVRTVQANGGVFAAASGHRGLLSDAQGTPPNVGANGVAAWFLTTQPGVWTPVLSAVTDELVNIKGVRVSAQDARQDNTLQAWPWFQDTFSWVEPTAWCLLALKRQRDVRATAVATRRVSEAEKMLENRCCELGGWNYGNASALGQDLRPHIPPTALGLLAMQDRRDSAAVQRSAGFLRQAALTEHSGMALGLAALALHVFGFDTSDVQERLLATSEQTERFGNVPAMAMAVCALTLDHHDGAAFRVPA